jgi:succinyl-diaminopimelate desuccinylase
MPKILASTRFSRPGRHLVRNGHIDVFPVGDRARWTRDPRSGGIADGRIHGRGTVDMNAVLQYLVHRIMNSFRV